MIGCVSLSLKWQRNLIWGTGGADFAFRRTRWMWRETFRHIRVEKGFCFSSYLQGRHNKWLEMMLVIFFDPAVFLDYSTACNLFCHSFKCNSVCLGWQQFYTCLRLGELYSPSLDATKSVWIRLMDIKGLLVMAISFLGFEPALLYAFICYVLKMPENVWCIQLFCALQFLVCWRFVFKIPSFHTSFSHSVVLSCSLKQIQCGVSVNTTAL